MKLAKLINQILNTGLIFIGVILIILAVASQTQASDCELLSPDVAYTTYEGSHYFLTNPGTWECAQSQADSAYGILASIHDVETSQFLADTYRDEYLWIGLVRDGYDWRWIDGSAFDFWNWAPGQPLSYPNYVGILNTHGNLKAFASSSPDLIYRGIVQR
ncbi:C-type lectin domain-containing protein [Planktothrix paucivesiculata]|uniref:C-type lectin domain-containing protein n=1 Tax=Planktothrix paucivesiculata PCC 9631 TaxID=671071 RepID=A0A7Z9BNA4_9CYAN|nr:C-type lectin domain-containing protein [Planktothrix paucivesiculata]VXD18450.1 exported hypothetical protein [Planktothrix paucivesiculata PCC 9631]